MKKSSLYIQMFSIHGLVRSENMELGHDADTGGQVKYVVELARALSNSDAVAQVDLFTRLISDKSVSDDYGKPVEKVTDKFRIVRIQCGGRKYIRKELLRPHLDEFVDKTIRHMKRESRMPDIVHGHYPDAGYVALNLSEIFGIPFVYTGHSLGRSKLARLLKDGMTEKDITSKYKIDHRIQMEEEILKSADFVVASTHQEVNEQYGLYENRNVPKYSVIPPGLDVDRFYPFYHDMLSEITKEEAEVYAEASVLEELNRFFMHPDRPLILSLCRPDKRKNITGLIRAYGEDKSLQSMANLAVFAGIRKDITEKEENERDVLTRILLLMDKYDLYGKIAIPKKHDFEYEVPALYRIAADKKGVFVNSALTEPFGITLLEAAATGLPIVAPNDGGPQDIIKNCDCGLLVDTTDTKELAGAIKTLIIDAAKWKAFSKNGIMNVRKYYTWEAHGTAYVDNIRSVLKKFQPNDMTRARPTDAIGRRIAGLNYFLVTDIDNTLIGDDNSHLADLCDLLTNYRDCIGFAVATGRTIDSAVSYLQKFNVPVPDIIISSVGTEIYYGPERHYSRGWDTHISAKWNREKIVALLADFSFLTYQEEATQRKFKISYDMKPGKDRLANIHSRLLENKCSYNLIYSHDKYLDILPYRASKGKAVRYLSYKWDIPFKNFLVCGDSGNDEEMLRGEPMAAVMGNFSPEVAHLKGQRKVFFVKSPCAGGILEAVRHYRFIEKAGG